MKKRPEEWMELLKDNKLEEGDYWIELRDGSVIVEHYSNKHDIYSFFTWPEKISKIIDKVPDYEYWQGFNEEHDQMYYTIKALEAELKTALEIIDKDGKHDRWLEKNYPKYYKKETNM